MLILPAIDLRRGECVRLLRGRFDQATRYDTDPRARLEAFIASGAQWVHIVDLDGAEEGGARQHALIGDLARTTGAQVQAGGGVRTSEDVERLLDAGVSRVVVGSAAVQRPDEVIDWMAHFGADRLTLALDVRVEEGQPFVATNGWTKGSRLTLWDALDRLAASGPRHMLVTDIDRDGALEGPNLGLAASILARVPGIALQASGGVASLADIVALKSAGVPAVIVGRALYEGAFRLEEALGAG